MFTKLKAMQGDHHMIEEIVEGWDFGNNIILS